MANPVVHFEIMGGDPIAQQKLYADLFGWKIENMGPDMGNYGLVDTQGGEGINGAVGAAPDAPSYTTIYVAVPNPQAILDKAESLGGKTTVPVTEIPNVVTFAMFVDRQGNMIGLVKDDQPGHEHPEGQGQGPSKGKGAPLGWFEISSGDPKDARAFYADLFGWTVGTESEGEAVYDHLTLDERGISGAIATSQDGSPRVNLWAKVPSLEKALEKAAKLGAKPALEPMKVSDDLTVAGFVDPAGNFFGLYRQS